MHNISAEQVDPFSYRPLPNLIWLLTILTTDLEALTVKAVFSPSVNIAVERQIVVRTISAECNNID